MKAEFDLFWRSGRALPAHGGIMGKMKRIRAEALRRQRQAFMLARISSGECLIATRRP